MNKFFNEKYDWFDSYEYHFVEYLKDIFGNRKMIRRYSLGGEGIFNLLYTDNGIYQFKFKQISTLPISDGVLAVRDNKKNEVIDQVAKSLEENGITYSVTGGKFLNVKDSNFITQIELIKKRSEPANLGKTRIDGEWI